MKNYVSAAYFAGICIILICFLVVSCVRFVPPALEDPAVVFGRIVFSSGLNQKSDWAGPVGEAGKVFERYIARDVIFVSDDKPNGLWTVAVFMDGQLIGSNDFEIK
jgi:hypothetical protein